MDVGTMRLCVVCSSSSDSDSESPPLERVFMGVTCGLLFIAGKNALVIMVTMCKNNIL